MTDAQQRAAAKEFAAYWKGKGYEKGESQPFGFPCFAMYMESNIPNSL